MGGDSTEEARGKAEKLLKEMQEEEAINTEDKESQESIWVVRESGLGARAFVPGMKDTWPGWEDSAVHSDQLGEYLKELKGRNAMHFSEVILKGIKISEE